MNKTLLCSSTTAPPPTAITCIPIAVFIPIRPISIPISIPIPIPIPIPISPTLSTSTPSTSRQAKHQQTYQSHTLFLESWVASINAFFSSSFGYG